MSEHELVNENEDLQEVASDVTLEQLKNENSQLFARLQRLQADFDNYRKRVKSEKQEWTEQAVYDLMRELLAVVDNLDRACQAGGSSETLLAGIELVYKQLLSVLEKQGLNAIEASGMEFNPNYHHAVIQVDSEEPENTIVEELQKGYRLHERVLRPSMVKVAK